jgi:hypothetical protein
MCAQDQVSIHIHNKVTTEEPISQIDIIIIIIISLKTKTTLSKNRLKDIITPKAIYHR